MQIFPLAPGRRRDFVRHEIRRRRIVLRDRVPLTDTIVRFTFGGDLDGFLSDGPEDHVRVFFPADEGPVSRDYTPGGHRPADGSTGAELDIDMVVHGDVGPASSWATRAGIGDVLEFGGPRGSRLAPSGYRNAVLVADPSGFPALRRWIHAYAGRMPVQAVLFGSDARATAYLDDPERALARPVEVGDDALDLLSAVRRQDVDDDTLVWAAGEAASLIPLRRWLRSERALPPENLSLHGYWRRGEAGLGDHVSIDPADPD